VRAPPRSGLPPVDSRPVVLHLTKPLLTASVLIAGLLVVRFFLPYMGPFLLALVLAALVDAPVNRLEKKGLARGLAVLLVLAGLVLILGAITVLVAARIWTDLNHLAVELPAWSNALEKQLAAWAARLEGISAGLPHQAGAMLSRLSAAVEAAIESTLRQALTAVAAVPGALAWFMVALLAAFFLSRDGRRLSYSLLACLPEAWSGKIRRLNREVFFGLTGFVRAQLLLMALTAALATLAFLLFRLPYAWLLGLLAGVLDIIPFVGPSGVFLPLAFGLAARGYTAAAAGLVASLAIILIIRQLAEPLIISAKVGLHPLTSLAAVYIGIKVSGFTGLFAGPLAALALKALWLGVIRPLFLLPPPDG